MRDGQISFLIHNLQVLQREIGIEGNQQIVTIMKVFASDIPEYTARLRRLEELENMVPRLIEKIRKLECDRDAARMQETQEKQGNGPVTDELAS